MTVYTYLEQAFRFFNQILDSTSRWSMPVWIALGVFCLVLGFILLRGNMLRGA
ncbi:MAG TPA: hypothetical protein PKD54_05200 [Pirellulaceae bacterium]|nr:hypothetical protein [Pirellulaceae bacterium]